MSDSTVKDVLKEKDDFILSVSPDTTAFDAINKMVNHKIGSVLVLEDDDLKGIFTERDYLRRITLNPEASEQVPVGEVMSTDLIVVDPSYDVEECLAINTEQKIRHLPVVEEGTTGNLVGIISIGDCVKQLSKERQTRIRYLNQYIRGDYPV